PRYRPSPPPARYRRRPRRRRQPRVPADRDWKLSSTRALRDGRFPARPRPATAQPHHHARGSPRLLKTCRGLGDLTSYPLTSAIINPAWLSTTDHARPLLIVGGGRVLPAV